MLAALQRYPRAQRAAVARAWARRSHAVQAAARLTREPDFTTLRRRALDEQRGQILREGVTYRGDGRVLAWRVRRARAGRVNQVEIVVGGRVWRRCAHRTAARLLRRQLAVN